MVYKEDILEFLHDLEEDPTSSYESGGQDMLYHIRHFVEDMIEYMQWTSCKDELPELDGVYLVYAPNYTGGSSSGKENHKGIMFSKFKNGKWSIEHGYHKRPNCVKAWMPLPDQYKGGEQNGFN